jgi:hypothetical protein
MRRCRLDSYGKRDFFLFKKNSTTQHMYTHTHTERKYKTGWRPKPKQGMRIHNVQKVLLNK